jgi:hypothetical protein
MPPGGYPGPQSGDVPYSVLELPFQVSLHDLFRQVERSVPRQVGQWGRWTRWKGIEVQYLAWRGPLHFQARGETLLVQAEVGYSIKARKKFLKTLSVSGSCGVDEPPRRALVGVQLRLDWSADWTPRPVYRVLPARFPDRCEMTAAEIDVTGVVGQLFQQQLKDSLDGMLEQVVPRLSQVRQQAAEAWRSLQQPVQLGDGYRLWLRPFGVALSALSGWGDRANVNVAIAMRPQLVTGEPAERAEVPLPPLMRLYPRGNGVYLGLALEVDYARVSRQLTAALAGRTFETKGQRFGISNLDIAAAGENAIEVGLALTGALAGRASIRANVAFDSGGQAFVVRELDFHYDPEDPGMGFLAEAFHDRIREAIEEGANQLLQERVDTFVLKLTEHLVQFAPSGLRVNLDSLRLQGVQVVFGSSGITLHGLASGVIVLHGN